MQALERRGGRRGGPGQVTCSGLRLAQATIAAQRWAYFIDASTTAAPGVPSSLHSKQPMLWKSLSNWHCSRLSLATWPVALLEPNATCHRAAGQGQVTCTRHARRPVLRNTTAHTRTLNRSTSTLGSHGPGQKLMLALFAEQREWGGSSATRRTEYPLQMHDDHKQRRRTARHHTPRLRASWYISLRNAGSFPTSTSDATIPTPRSYFSSSSPSPSAQSPPPFRPPSSPPSSSSPSPSPPP